MSSLKVIGILGCNFCGSTALSAILDCLPHVLSVGETHRLIDRAWGCKKCTYILCEKCKACPGCTDTRPVKSVEIGLIASLFPAVLTEGVGNVETRPVRFLRQSFSNS